jgi:hypothetical protein
MPTGQRHLITCRCILQQFKRLSNPPQHQFTVFSVIDDSDCVVPSYAQCNNCGIVHRIIDLCKSEIVPGKESMQSIVTIGDIEASLPEKLALILRSNDADLSSWLAAQFVYENKRWGEFVVLTTDTDGDSKQGKYVRILGEQLFKVESYVRDEVVK